MKTVQTMQTMQSEMNIADLAKTLDRSVRTVKEWEKRGLIPRARRDSRGWRVYSSEQAERILKHVKKKKFFLQFP